MRTFLETGFYGGYEVNKQTYISLDSSPGAGGCRNVVTFVYLLCSVQHGNHTFLWTQLLFCLHHTPNTVHFLRQKLKRLSLFSALFGLRCIIGQSPSEIWILESNDDTEGSARWSVFYYGHCDL